MSIRNIYVPELSYLTTKKKFFTFENRSFLGEFEAEPVNQGPREYYLMKKNEGRKSGDTVPLSEAHKGGLSSYELILTQFYI
jgi:hypothetical protein